MNCISLSLSSPYPKRSCVRSLCYPCPTYLSVRQSVCALFSYSSSKITILKRTTNDSLFIWGKGQSPCTQTVVVTVLARNRWNRLLRTVSTDLQADLPETRTKHTCWHREQKTSSGTLAHWRTFLHSFPISLTICCCILLSLSVRLSERAVCSIRLASEIKYTTKLQQRTCGRRGPDASSGW